MRLYRPLDIRRTWASIHFHVCPLPAKMRTMCWHDKMLFCGTAITVLLMRLLWYISSGWHRRLLKEKRDRQWPGDVSHLVFCLLSRVSLLLLLLGMLNTTTFAHFHCPTVTAVPATIGCLGWGTNQDYTTNYINGYCFLGSSSWS